MLYGICEIGNETFYMIRDPGPEDLGATRFVSYDALRSQYLFDEQNPDASIYGMWAHTFVYLDETYSGTATIRTLPTEQRSYRNQGGFL